MSYDDTLPTDLDKARALLGDTATTELLTDDHIEAVLALYSFNSSVAFLATELATRYAQKPGSVSANGKSVSWADRVRTWLALATQMRAGGVTGPPSVAPYAGGLSKTDKRTVEGDTDRVQPVFTKNLQGDPPSEVCAV